MVQLFRYKNGNYNVSLFDDGTKIRYTKEDTFKPEFSENIDIKLTNRCPIQCKFCHENSSINGNAPKKLVPDLTAMKLHPGTEVALGGGALSTIPSDEFLAVCKTLAVAQICANITINQFELNDDTFYKNLNIALSLMWIRGVGVSLMNIFDEQSIIRLLELMHLYPNSIVIHTIYGITTEETYKFLSNIHAKVLVLGYKSFRRGAWYQKSADAEIKANQASFIDNLDSYRHNFSVMSFDNLALEQTNLKSRVSSAEWERLYMGDDGRFTMFVDLVSRTFSKNSTTPMNERFTFGKSVPTAQEMFKKVNGGN